MVQSADYPYQLASLSIICKLSLICRLGHVVKLFSRRINTAYRVAYSLPVVIVVSLSISSTWHRSTNVEIFGTTAGSTAACRGLTLSSQADWLQRCRSGGLARTVVLRRTLMHYISTLNIGWYVRHVAEVSFVRDETQLCEAAIDAAELLRNGMRCIEKLGPMA